MRRLLQCISCRVSLILGQAGADQLECTDPACNSSRKTARGLLMNVCSKGAGQGDEDLVPSS